MIREKPLTEGRRVLLVSELEELQLAPEHDGGLLDKMICERIDTIREILREGVERWQDSKK